MIFNRSTVLVPLLAAFAASVVISTPAAAEPLPAVRMIAAPMVTPATAWSYYGTSTTHTNGAAALTGRAPEIVEIARALGNNRYNADLYATTVYEYVRNNIETEFRFGLSKGARGAVVDQSGTPFDQAALLVELLREGGVTAGYRVGTITLNAIQFTDWTGLTNATAACKFLADGGFPATVNGESDCNSPALVGNSVTAVAMGHIWVAANAKLYDPSYKKYAPKAGLNLASVINCGASCGTNVLSSIAAAANYPGTTAPSVASANQTNIDAGLKTAATSLQTYIQNQNATNKNNLQVEDIVGGSQIDPTSPFQIGTTLPYITPTSTVYTWNGEIPDPFRTTLQVQYDTINQLLFADEISGQRVRLWAGQTLAQRDGSTTTTAGRTVGLYVEFKPLAKSVNNAGSPFDPVTLRIL